MERFYKFEVVIHEDGRADVTRDSKGLLTHEIVGILEIEKAVMLAPVMKASQREEPSFSIVPDDSELPEEQ